MYKNDKYSLNKIYKYSLANNYKYSLASSNKYSLDRNNKYSLNANISVLEGKTVTRGSLTRVVRCAMPRYNNHYYYHIIL